jgi:hypothetical protein
MKPDAIFFAHTTGRNWTNKDIAKFHYFNEGHGLNAQKRTVDFEIDNLVAEGLCKSGAIIAYGGLNYFYTDILRELVTKKRVNGIELQVCLQGLQRDIEKAQAFIAEIRSTQTEVV